MKVFYSADYVAADVEFDTMRKAKHIADSLLARPISAVQLCEPRPVTRDELLLAHTTNYVDCVLTGGGHPDSERRHKTNGFKWSEGLVRAVTASTGGVLEAVAAALKDGVSGSLSSGLHHAHRDRGEGFCTFNGLAVAALCALEQGDVHSVLIIDLDAHWGNGTMEIVGDDRRIEIIDVSTGTWEGRVAEVGRREAHYLNHAVDYIATVERLLEGIDPRSVDLVLYNAGMDPHEDCGIGQMAAMTDAVLEQREETVFQWCERYRLPVAFVLAGGYATGGLTPERLVDLHRLTIAAAAQTSGAA